MFQAVQQNMMQILAIFEDDLITQETVHYIILSDLVFIKLHLLHNPQFYNHDFYVIIYVIY